MGGLRLTRKIRVADLTVAAIVWVPVGTCSGVACADRRFVARRPPHARLLCQPRLWVAGVRRAVVDGRLRPSSGCF